MKLANNWALSHLWISLSPIISDFMTISNNVLHDPETFVTVHSTILEALDNRDLERLLTLIENQFVELIRKNFTQMLFNIKN